MTKLESKITLWKLIFRLLSISSKIIRPRFYLWQILLTIMRKILVAVICVLNLTAATTLASLMKKTISR